MITEKRISYSNLKEVLSDMLEIAVIRDGNVYTCKYLIILDGHLANIGFYMQMKKDCLKLIKKTNDLFQFFSHFKNHLFNHPSIRSIIHPAISPSTHQYYESVTRIADIDIKTTNRYV